jgi:DNA-directed RNA polymerase specialized sigma24 family protein
VVQQIIWCCGLAQRVQPTYIGYSEWECTMMWFHRHKNELATAEYFAKVFTEQADNLYQLAFLLTGDSEAAVQAFVAGVEESVGASGVFREWAHAWAKRAIMKNAIRALQPRPESVHTSTNNQERDAHPIRPTNPQMLAHRVLSLPTLERFVFVMSVLERYSDRDSALLLGCSLGEFRDARTRALKSMAHSGGAESSLKISAAESKQSIALEMK